MQNENFEGLYASISIILSGFSIGNESMFIIGETYTFGIVVNLPENFFLSFLF